MYKNKNHERPTLGQSIKAPDHLVRRKGTYCRWTLRADIPHLAKSKPIHGIYIGWRTLSDGDYHYSDGYYESSRRFEAWLIAYDPRKKPVFVRPEDCVTTAPKEQ